MHTRQLERYTTLIIILLAAFGFRIYQIANQSLWFDELATVSGVLYGHLNPAIIEPRSWLYVLIVSPFVALIPNEIGARWVSICAGVIATALIYRAGRALHTERAGLVAAALFTISPQLVIYGQEARAYSLITALCLAILWIIAISDRRPRIGWLLLILIPITVGAHLLALPVIAVILGVAALRKLITKRGTSWPILFASLAAMLVPAALILGIEQARAAASGGLGWVDWITASPPLVDLASFMIHALGLPPAGWMFDSLIGYALLGIILIWVRRPTSGRHFRPYQWRLALVIGMALIPPLLITLSSLIGLRFWLLRYMLPSMAAFILLVGMALANARPRMLGAVIMAAILGVSGILTQKYYTLPIFWREDWRSSVHYIAANVEDGDLVVACSTFYDGAMQFYLGDVRPDIIYLPAGHPDDIPQQVSDHLTSGGTIWMLNRADDCAPYTEWPSHPDLDPYRVEKTVFLGLTVYEFGQD